MRTLILKLGATGDVVRTTALLRSLPGAKTWVTTGGNQSLLHGLDTRAGELRVLTWEERSLLDGNTFDLAVNLEDEPETATILKRVNVSSVFGAYPDRDGQMTYSPNSHAWFDMSLISVHGREKADLLKFQNRRSYQELLFEGLGLKFSGERYVLPPTQPSSLRGDVAIAAEAGPVWPMKKWAYYEDLKRELAKQGLRVNYLPKRPTLLDHLADVRGHRCLVSGDSLPMHLALGSGIPGVALFTCTSPWEIYDYGLLQKVTSPLLAEFFYKRGFDVRATTCISLKEVLGATLRALQLQPAHDGH